MLQLGFEPGIFNLKIFEDKITDRWSFNLCSTKVVPFVAIWCCFWGKMKMIENRKLIIVPNCPYELFRTWSKIWHNTTTGKGFHFTRQLERERKASGSLCIYLFMSGSTMGCILPPHWLRIQPSLSIYLLLGHNVCGEW